MEKRKMIALVANDNNKDDLVEWVKFNSYLLSLHELYAKGTTDKIINKELGIKISKLQSVPLGGDQQIGARIQVAKLIF